MNMCHLSNKGQWAAEGLEGFWSLDLKVFCWLRPSSKSSLQKEKQRSWKKQRGMPLAWLPDAILIPGRDDNFLFYVWVIHTARSDSACVSLPLWQMVTWHHPRIKQTLILNITAFTLFLYFLYTMRLFLFPGPKHPTCWFHVSLLKPDGNKEEKEAGHVTLIQG